MSRTSKMQQKTAETNIVISIDLDGTGRSDIDTGIGFFDHMLKSFAKHGFFDLTVMWMGIWWWTATIPSRIPGSCWEKPYQKPWEIRKASAATAAASSHG